MAKKRWFDWLGIVLLVVGGLNWGLIGLFNYNLVTFVFGNALFTKIVYVLVGFSSVYVPIRFVVLRIK